MSLFSSSLPNYSWNQTCIGKGLTESYHVLSPHCRPHFLNSESRCKLFGGILMWPATFSSLQSAAYIRKVCSSSFLRSPAILRSKWELQGHLYQRNDLAKRIDQELLAGLNEEQRLAVLADDGPIRVIAGPGSGKTRVLTHRVAHLIVERGIPASNIMCITFTNKAANELQERLKKLIPEKFATGLTVGTFHRVSARILRNNLHLVPEWNRNEAFVIWDSEDAKKAVKAIIDKHLGSKPGAQKAKLDMYSIMRDLDQYKASSITSYIGMKRGFGRASLNLSRLNELVPNLPEHYENVLKQNNAVDFSDIIHLPIRLLHELPSVLENYRQLFKHVLVDEFQDTDNAQYEFVRLLAGKSQNVFIVGDVDQAIYGWRGADPDNLQYSFQEDFQDVKTMKLEQNYRSSAHILDAAMGLIERSEVSRSFGDCDALKLQAFKPQGHPILVGSFTSDRDEAQGVVSEILRLQKLGSPWRSFAVLYRTNRQARQFEEHLMKARVPYKVFGGIPFYARKEVRDLVAYLRLILNPRDERSLERIYNVPPRAFGVKSWESLQQWTSSLQTTPCKVLELGHDELPLHSEMGITARARRSLINFGQLIAKWRALSKTSSVADVLADIVQELNYEAYIDAIDDEETKKTKAASSRTRSSYVKELIDIAAEVEVDVGVGVAGLSAFLEDLALVSAAEHPPEGIQKGPGDEDMVKLMTLHSSKGLEFPTVFLTGLEEDLLPLHSRNAREANEERRLCYVGMTRAKDRLYLSHCIKRFTMGVWLTCKPSRYLVEFREGTSSVTLQPTVGLWTPVDSALTKSYL